MCRSEIAAGDASANVSLRVEIPVAIRSFRDRPGNACPRREPILEDEGCGTVGARQGPYAQRRGVQAV